MKKKFLTVFFLLLVLSVGGSTAFFMSEQLGLFLIERNKPLLSLQNTPKGLGIDKQTLTYFVQDTGAGIKSVTVETVQGEKRQEIFTQTFPERTLQKSIALEFFPQKPLLTPGEVTIIATVIDGTIWKNETKETITLPVDYDAPRPEILTVQHNGRESGALLVFYGLSDKDISKTGVQVHDTFIPGYAAAKLDPAFSDRPNLYFSLFPIPLEFESEGGDIVLIAEDKVGNTGKTSFYHRIKDLSFKEVDMKLSRSFFDSSIQKLLAKYHTFAGLPYAAKEPRDMSEEEVVKNFKLINENYRGDLEKVLVKLSAQSEETKYWDGPFEKPMPSKPTASFGESRSYFLGDQPAGGSKHLGVDLAKTLQSPVHAAAKGKVVFADDLGIYGNTVVIDHGFGLQTLYGHHSSLKVKVGEIVEKGDVIGRTGATGLAGGDHLHFEIRLHNQSVTPFEWLDPLWIKTHIEDQIAFVKGEPEQ